MSGARPTRTPVNFGGAMPTTVNCRPLSASVRPTSDGSEPKRRCQKPWPRTTTVAGFAGLSSSGVKKRPAAGLTPSTEKALPVKTIPKTRSDCSPAFRL